MNNPEQYQGFNQIGWLLFQQKKYEHALKYFQDGLRINHNHPTFYINIAYTLSQLQRNEEALQQLGNAIILEPNNIKLHNVKCYFLAKMEKWNEMIKLSQYITYQLQNQQNKGKLNQSNFILGNQFVVQNHRDQTNQNLGVNISDPRFQLLNVSQSQSSSANILYNQGFALFKQGRNDEAITKFDEALKQDPSLVQAYLMKGQALRNIQQFSKALNCYQININNIHDDKIKASYLYEKGFTLFHLNRHQEAIQLFDESLSIEQNQNDDSHNVKALSLLAIGQPDSALDSINKALENSSQNPKIIYNKAYILFKMKKFQEALICINNAIHGNEDNAILYNTKGSILEKLEEFEQAKICYQLAIEKDSSTPIFYSNLANLLFSQKDYHEALNICDTAIGRNITSAKIFQCKAQIFLHQKQMDECRKNFKNAIRESSCSSNEYREFALVLRQQGDLKKALKYVKKGIDMDPETEENFVVYATILYEMGKHNQALEIIRQGLQANPNHKALNLQKKYFENLLKRQI